MVSNQMMSMDTAIHWHGLHVREAPYMDGVPMVTQCPILPFTSFEYRFVADKSGSFIWHSHDGLQKANGVMGPIIVREVNDSQGHLYDYDLQEHVIVITDWRQTSADYQFLMHHHSNMDNKPTSILVNGKGKYKLFLDPIQNRTVHVPYQVFNVLPDKRYRFRLFSNGVLNSPVQVSIDHHSLMVIATDGFPVQPLWTDSLIVYSGERFDFVVETKQKVGNFWFRFRGLLDGDQRYYGVYQGAILRYEGASQENPSEEMTYHHTSEKNSRVRTLDSGRSWRTYTSSFLE